jgi:hypothetical protein
MNRSSSARSRIAPPSTHGRPSLSLITFDDEVTSPAETCDEMIKELEREIAASRSTAHARGFLIVAAELAQRSPHFTEYRLTLADVPPPIRGDDVVLLALPGKAPIPGNVLGCRGRMLRLAVIDALPTPLPPNSQLVLDASWLLERLHDRLQVIRNALAAQRLPEDFTADLAQMAVGRGNFEQNVLGGREYLSDLDPAHLERGLESLNEGQRHAVELAVARRVLYVWGPPGTGKTTTLAALVLAHVLAGRRVLVVTPSNGAADVIAGAIARRLQGLEGFDRGLALRVGPRPGDALLRQHGSRLVPSQIAARLCDAAYGGHRAELEAALETARQAVQVTEPKSRARRDASRLLRNIETESRALAAVETAYQDRCADELLGTCRVAIAPVHHVYLSHQIRGEWDVVIVDQASMMTGPQLYLAAGRSNAQVVVAGDFMQLPAPVIHDHPAEVPWLSQDPFQRLGIPDDVARGDDPPYMVMLTEQYRMKPAIADLVSTMFYADRLRTAPAVVRRPAAEWLAHPRAGSLVLIDTTEADPRAMIPSGTRSRTNPVHARITVDVVGKLLDGAARADGPCSSMLVLSPYASQVLHLRDALAPLRREHRGVRASTVHRAQGDEADTVLLCLDDAPGAPTSRFMSARCWTDAGARLVNVGISRARGRLIVLAPVDHLLRSGGPVVRRLLELLQERATLLEWTDPRYSVRG